MSFITTDDGVKLYYEEAGTGTPLVFVHEYAGDWRSWEPQMRFFSRKHRCVTYSFRGYAPSDIPDAGSKYGQDRVVEDIRCVLDGLQIDKAHICGLSMGGFAAAHFARVHPERMLSAAICGCGFGSEKEQHAAFAAASRANGEKIRKIGQAAFAAEYGEGAGRKRFRQKDPRGHAEFMDQFAGHDPIGAAHTVIEFQGKRPSLWDFEEAWKACTVPSLIVAGDEDDMVLLSSLYLKKVMGNAGLLVMPKTGHAVNLEEPDAFNRALWDFIALVEAGRWTPRED